MNILRPALFFGIFAKVFAEAVKDQLSGEQTAVKHLDETGLRVAGKTRWIHVLCSIALSYFWLGVSRGDVPKYLLGTAVHDCFTSNWTLKGVKHGVCNSHTLRELKALIEFEKEPWASDMTTILLDAKKIRDIARSQGQDAVEPEAIKEIERRYDACCEQAITVHENQLPLTPESEKKARPTETAHWTQSRFAFQRLEIKCFTVS